MTPYLPSECALDGGEYRYDLYATVNHHGRSVNEGHFVCHGYSHSQLSWLLFNDARVNVVTPEKVQESQAYLLFFKRQEKPRPPNPPA
jgi:ubiquitin C-terminal hydrolase